MATAVIVDAIRTAGGKGKAARNGRPGGALAEVLPVDLLSGVLEALVARHDLDPALIDDVMVGCAQQVGEQAANIARTAVLGAGFPESVPATTVNRQCGSSQQTAAFAAQAVMAGVHDVIIAGGVESMSSVPIGSQPTTDSERLRRRYPEGLVNQGVSAELVARRWKLERDELDAYSAESHRRAAVAWKDGFFDREVVPVALPDGSEHTVDETVRGDTTAEGLAGLKPSFATEEMVARFPDVEWKITPGNSSPLTDGASAALIMSEERANQLGLRPRARFHSFSLAGDDPLMMLTAPIPATRKVLERTGLSIDDIDAYEVNEAFAPVPLAWLREFGADPEKLNPRGGAIALGHPLGSSGTRLLATLLHHLEATGGRYGLQTMCEAGGMANATIIERI